MRVIDVGGSTVARVGDFRYPKPLYGAGHGAVAQLGERLNGIQEVGGSTPLSSTRAFPRVRVTPIA